MWSRARTDPNVPARPTIRGLYDRLAGDDGVVREGDVRGYLEGLELSASAARGVGAVVDRFMTTFDPTGARQVTWSDFVCGGKRAIPPELLDASGAIDKERVDALTGFERATAEELAPRIHHEIMARSRSPFVSLWAKTAAEAGAKLAMSALDADGDRQVSRADVHALIDDFNAACAPCERYWAGLRAKD